MGFLENLGRKHFPPPEHLKRVSTRRLKLWMWFLPCAGLFPSVAILMSGHVAVGLVLVIPGLLVGGFIAWVRFQMVTPIIEERERQSRMPPPAPPARRATPTNVAKRDRERRAKKRRGR